VKEEKSDSVGHNIITQCVQLTVDCNDIVIGLHINIILFCILWIDVLPIIENYDITVGTAQIHFTIYRIGTVQRGLRLCFVLQYLLFRVG